MCIRDRHYELVRPIPGMAFEHQINGPFVRGGDIRFSDVTRVEQTVPGVARPFRYNEVMNMAAKLADMNDPTLKQVGSEVGFTIVCDWRPWMKMGDRPGHMMCVGSGRIGGKPDSLPAPWIAGMKARHPDALADPAAVLAPAWK